MDRRGWRKYAPYRRWLYLYTARSQLNSVTRSHHYLVRAMSSNMATSANAVGTGRRLPGWLDLVNVAGSVASITGISLLWMRDCIDWSEAAITMPILAVFSAIVLGGLTLGFIGLRYGYRRWAKPRDSAWRIAYLAFAIPLAIAFTTAVGASGRSLSSCSSTTSSSSSLHGQSNPYTLRHA
jgi:hypothetical protein